MQAKTDRRPRPAQAASMGVDRMCECVDALNLAATAFVSPAKVDDTVRGWLMRVEPAAGTESQLFADALLMAMDLALFTPSASGQTAFDRMARQRTGLSADEAAVLAAMRQAAFRIMQVAEGGTDGSRLRDIATGEVLRLPGGSIGADLAGLPLAARLAPVGDGQHIFVSCVTPLDEAGLAAASMFIRPGNRGLSNPQRCAEAIYRHVLRYGNPRIPGLNDPLDGDDGLPEDASELDHIALRWAEPDAPHTAEDVQRIREDCGMDAVLSMVMSVLNTRIAGERALSSAYRDVLQAQLETVHRRRAIGSALPGLDAFAAQIAAEVASGDMPAAAAEVFAEARRRLGAGALDTGRGARDADLDRLIARIQALRAKTVEQGCTEAEALAAAEKVAELLDRYGLSLSELDLKNQVCEGTAVETGRKRVAPVDDCVPSVAAFFDCRVWGEKGGDGRLRYVFFGLPADVVAARYLYDLVEMAFETETAAFRAGSTYAEMPSSLRRTATNSFGIGLARGIVAKLHTLRQAREGALRGASGRDLVVAKADVVEAELARLGLQFRARKGPAGRRVLQDAYDEGHEAGLGFEYAPGVTDGRSR